MGSPPGLSNVFVMFFLKKMFFSQNRRILGFSDRFFQVATQMHDSAETFRHIVSPHGPTPHISTIISPSVRIISVHPRISVIYSAHDLFRFIQIADTPQPYRHGHRARRSGLHPEQQFDIDRRRHQFIDRQNRCGVRAVPRYRGACRRQDGCRTLSRTGCPRRLDRSYVEGFKAEPFGIVRFLPAGNAEIPMAGNHDGALRNQRTELQPRQSHRHDPDHEEDPGRLEDRRHGFAARPAAGTNGLDAGRPRRQRRNNTDQVKISVHVELYLPHLELNYFKLKII